MFFTKTHNSTPNPDILIAGEKVQIVTEFKYLGIIIDSQLNFKSHATKTVNIIKFNLSNFRYIRNNMSTQAAKMFMHSMIFSHITYCLTSWSQADQTTLKPLQSLYKQTLKVLDRKPRRYHHCNILSKYNLLSWENLIKFTNICLAYKILHGLAPPPLCDFLSVRSNNNHNTRATSRGDCVIPFRKTAFGKSAFSYKTSNEWNTIPTSIREINSYDLFRVQLKCWLLSNQSCQH